MKSKYILPYLPTLQVVYFDDERNEKMVSHVEQIHLPDEITILSINGELQYDLFIDEVYPLLVPLFDLTDEEWLLIFHAGNSMIDLGPLSVTHLYERIHIKTKNEDTILSYNPGNNSFYHLYPFNQLLAFEKLFELQADVFGLIKKDLAFNKKEYES